MVVGRRIGAEEDRQLVCMETDMDVRRLVVREHVSKGTNSSSASARTHFSSGIYLIVPHPS